MTPQLVARLEMHDGQLADASVQRGNVIALPRRAGPTSISAFRFDEVAG
jgi:hypothetical protein